ncbi:hypothetical protein I4U23_016341 [Adineta vaga]|nr:hypothetical protein I4U23_016341 [Adineta vaga]
MNTTTITFTTETENAFAAGNSASSRRITYAILQPFQLLALPAYLFVGFHLLNNQNMRQKLRNHSIMVLLACNFIVLTIDVSFVLDFLRSGSTTPSTDVTCLAWLFIDLCTYNASNLLMCWVAIERHLLTFHMHWLNTLNRRILLHYLPLASIVIYSVIYYIYVIFFYPCENNFNFNYAFCGYPCYVFQLAPSLFNVETLLYQVAPCFIIGGFSAALLIRTITGKYIRRQVIELRRYKKMALHLITISVVFLFFDIPYAINPLSQLINGSQPINVVLQINVLGYWQFGTCIFLPYAVGISLPDCRNKLRRLFSLQRWPIIPAS